MATVIRLRQVGSKICTVRTIKIPKRYAIGIVILIRVA